MLHLNTTIEQLRAAGVALVSLSEAWVDTMDTSPMADLVRNILGSIAQFERGLISERVKMGLARARQQGRKPGRPVKVNGNLEELRPLIESGALSMSAAAHRLGVHVSTVSRSL
jgi:DNA invertase Pin-like site-specific DNA recombinase